MSNSYKLCPTYFSRGVKNFAEEANPPGHGPAYTALGIKNGTQQNS